MGIPSYYKKLIDTIPNLVFKDGKNINEVDWLWMDFNCLIYHCLGRDDLSPYPGHLQKEEWEKELLDSVVKYCLKVVNKVKPKLGVRICIDGVVPMAKMRQQRLRRFKSSWMSLNSKDNSEKWDKNSITPGTLFMKKLRMRLETMSQKHKEINWHLSSSDEPGEGEHKIMADWRSGLFKGNFAIYGLDADLIVLSILNRELGGFNNKIWLFREEINAGKMSHDSLGEEIFEWFSIHELRDYLCSSYIDNQFEATKFILSYCFGMSVLGNDFLPSSLGLKMREDGHSELIQLIRNILNQNIELIDPKNGEIVPFGILKLFNLLQENESDRICNFINKKINNARNLGMKSGDGEVNCEMKLGENNWPLSCIEEEILLITHNHNYKGRRQLKDDWKCLYFNWFNGFMYNKNSIEKICMEYLTGIQWIWKYYIGKMDCVCYNWYYPHNLPPLWEWLKEYVSKYGLPSMLNDRITKASDIKPQEQLCLVLPIESWSLITDQNLKNLPSKAPHYFPTEFSFDSIGKRYFWECEAEIPIPSIQEVKEILS